MEAAVGVRPSARRRAARFLAWALVFALAAAGGLTACGGSGGGASPEPEVDKGSPVLQQASQPGELSAFLQRKLRERAQLRAAGGSTGDLPSTIAVPAGAAPVPTASSSGTQRSATLTQEQGVDEPDLLKTDGTQLYSIDGVDLAAPRLRVHRRAADGSIAELARLALQKGDATALTINGLMLAEDEKSLVAGGMAWTVPISPCADLCPTLLPGPIWLRENTVVQRIDVSDPTHPASTVRLEFDGRWVDARRIGRHMVLVTEYRPMLAADILPAGTTAEEREAAIARTQAADALPRMRITNAAGATRSALQVQETQCFVQPGNASTELAITTITVLDLAAAELAPQSRCFLGGSEALYMTDAALYLASSRWLYRLEGAIWRYPERMKTDIHKFGFAAGALSYRGSGEVDGHLGWDAERKSYRLSEFNGDLRVLSFTGAVGWMSVADRGTTTPPSPATLTVLREATAGGMLAAVAKLPNERRPQPLGKPGEQVHGVRFVGERGYLVTFRQVDPLYVLDLADAADPRIAGVLELPGFSDHLVPLADGLLLGVGRDATPEGRLLGIKVSLLDVGDPAQPRELAAERFGSSGSTSALDASRHGLSLMHSGAVARLAMPVLLYDSGFSNPREGLQRLEVDTTARTLKAKALIAPVAAAFADLGAERSVQIGEQVYWLRAGQLSAHAW